MKLTLIVDEVGGSQIHAEGGDNLYRGAKWSIFGAFVPNKLALFDNDSSGAGRVRIVEGGALTPGKDVTFSFTDWRADRIVDKYSLDTTIGDGQTYSRFGSGIASIRGDLVYEVDFVYSTDGGQTWNNGTLDAHAIPDVIEGPDSANRTSYEKTIQLPNNAQGLQVAFHLRAYVVADPHYVYITRWKDGYQLGGKYLLRDVWDNNGGQNYSLAVRR
jgi:hypothetical protein